MNSKAPKKVKVFRIIARLNIGGPAIHTILLTAGLDTHYYDSFLITGTVEKGEGDMSYLAKEKAVRPIIIPELGRTLSIRKDLVAFWKLFLLIKKERPDIIHTHTAKAGALGRSAGLLFKLISHLNLTSYNLILIHTFHGHVLHSYFGRIKNSFFTSVERLLAMFTDKIIAVSESVRKEILDLKIVSPKKILTIPLGLELERFFNIEDITFGKEDYRKVGIIGRLVPIKNQQMFLEVAKKIKDTPGFKNKVKFYVVGDGPLRKELECYAESLGIKQDVNFTGWIKNLRAIYSELDIVALTSLNEGTPVALIEAQSAARPCVATCVGGVPNVIENGRSGILVPSFDVNGFTNALLQLLNNPDMAISMGRYGRKKIKTKFNEKRLFRDIMHLYEELLPCNKTIQ